MKIVYYWRFENPMAWDNDWVFTSQNPVTGELFEYHPSLDPGPLTKADIIAIEKSGNATAIAVVKSKQAMKRKP